jgi:hypothetical protein
MTAQRSLVVSLHDAHPGSCQWIGRQVEALADWGVPTTSILVVPRWHEDPTINFEPFGGDRGFIDRVTAWQRAGHELVLHGYYHRRVGPQARDTLANVFWTRLYTNNEAEFLDLPENEAKARIADGLRLFASLGWKASGFIAPAWLMASYLPNLLQTMGFHYTNRLRDFQPLQNATQPIASQSLCWSTRAGWRRVLSQIWNPCLFRRLSAKMCLLRFSLHPNDFCHKSIRSQIHSLVQAALQAGYRPTTYHSIATTN